MIRFLSEFFDGSYKRVDHNTGKRYSDDQLFVPGGTESVTFDFPESEERRSCFIENLIQDSEDPDIPYVTVTSDAGRSFFIPWLKGILINLNTDETQLTVTNLSQNDGYVRFLIIKP